MLQHLQIYVATYAYYLYSIYLHPGAPEVRQRSGRGQPEVSQRSVRGQPEFSQRSARGQAEVRQRG